MTQQAKLLAGDHYRVVFTLPHELLPPFASHRRLLVDTLFQSVRETLMTLRQDARHLGAEPGVLMALHTWGRNLSPHPHVHCLVTGGGISAAGRWRATKTPYLLPVRLVKALYRGKCLGLLHEAVTQGTLRPGPEQTPQDLHRLFGALCQREWHVRLKERYAMVRASRSTSRVTSKVVRLPTVVSAVWIPSRSRSAIKIIETASPSA